MNLLKHILYILCIPIILFLHLFFEHVSYISLVLIFSLILYKDMRLISYWWLLTIATIFLDVAFHFWLGTNLFVLTLILFLLKIFEKYIGNIFLDLVFTFFSLFLFKLLFTVFVFLQESFTFSFFGIQLLIESLIFALLNMLIYLVFRYVLHIFNSNVRNDGL